MKSKKLMSMALVLVLAASAFTGCSSTKEKKQIEGSNKPSTTATTALGKPEMIEITKQLYFGDASDDPDLKKEWPEVMEKKFGIKFKVNALPRTSYGEKLNLMITSGDAKGLVQYTGPSDIVKAIADGVIEPLDDYLKDNKVWNSLPETMREMYRIEGKVWAIPNGMTGNFFTRSIRKDWLDNLGLKVPETVDELYEVAKAFTLNDPDKNGKNDTFGLSTSKGWNIQDIFQAFDARLNDGGGGPITYDPNDKAWVDSMLKPGMADALKYLNKMYKEGILDKEMFTNTGAAMREKMFSGKYGSSFYWWTWGYGSFGINTKKNVPSADYIEIPALKGKIKKNLNQITFNNAPYVLIKGTKQPKEVVNSFIDIFFGDKEGHFMGRFGMPEKNFKLEDKKITLVRTPDGKAINNPIIVVEIPGLNQNVFPIFYSNDTPEAIKSRDELSKLVLSVREKGISEGMLFDMGTKYTTPISKTYTELNADMTKIFEEAFVKSVTGELTAEQAIENYRNQMKKIGAQKVLDETNKSLGTTTTLKY